MFQSQTGSQALSDRWNAPVQIVKDLRFNPKREARPSQTERRRDVDKWRFCFNPKREARPSQTEQIACVGIPTGKVSIPNGKPGPLRQGRKKMEDLFHGVFQSQTGSQALSDAALPMASHEIVLGFNPKREARPSQTHQEMKRCE